MEIRKFMENTINAQLEKDQNKNWRIETLKDGSVAYNANFASMYIVLPKEKDKAPIAIVSGNYGAKQRIQEGEFFMYELTDKSTERFAEERYFNRTLDKIIDKADEQDEAEVREVISESYSPMTPLPNEGKCGYTKAEKENRERVLKLANSS